MHPPTSSPALPPPPPVPQIAKDSRDGQHLDFNTEEEKTAVEEVFRRCEFRWEVGAAAEAGGLGTRKMGRRKGREALGSAVRTVHQPVLPLNAMQLPPLQRHCRPERGGPAVALCHLHASHAQGACVHVQVGCPPPEPPQSHAEFAVPC